MSNDTKKLVWYKALDKDELPEGRVKPVTLGHLTVAMTHYKGRYGALNNKCPHQGGPLGEGSIENGLLRCPWHGWDFCPLKGNTPGYEDGVEAYEVEVRDEGIYVGLEKESSPVTTVSDIMAETMTNWGVKHVFGIVGHSNLGLADALRIQEEKGNLKYYGVRHELAASFAVSAYEKLTGRPAACLSITGPGATNLLTGLWDANVDRSPVIALTGHVDTPVVGAGIAYVTGGTPPIRPVYAIRAGLRQKIEYTPGETPEALVWAHGRGGGYLPTPLLYRGLLYVVHHPGRISVYDAADGEVVYRKRFSRGGTFSASPVASNGRLYLPAEGGLLYVIAAGRSFQELAIHDFKEPLMATPAISEGVLYVRTRSRLIAIGKRPPFGDRE